jgi:anti-sigma B factor antagonist
VEMTVQELAGPVTAVRLAGRLDAAGSDAISLRFTAAVATAGRDAVVDLAGVSFVASMGMRLLVSAARSLAQKGHRLVAFAAPELVQGALQDAGIDQIIPCVATEADALATLHR